MTAGQQPDCCGFLLLFILTQLFRLSLSLLCNRRGEKYRRLPGREMISGARRIWLKPIIWLTVYLAALIFVRARARLVSGPAN